MVVQTLTQATFSKTQLNLLLTRFFEQYRRHPGEFNSDKYYSQYDNLFKKVGKDGLDFYWGQIGVETVYDYFDADEYKQWLVDSGECEDWEEASDVSANLDWDECSYLDWALKESPGASSNKELEFQNIKSLYIELFQEKYPSEYDYESEEDLLNRAITDVSLAQRILDSLTK